ncbi:MAG: hypothetical protein J0I26_02595, partial [Alphaproteobacteria bacterium]|nr:hypothetical protein [Alphaproteobacteria bacterium]
KPFIAAQAGETERRRRPSDEVWRAILKTGYMYLAVPKRFGGLQASMMDIMDATLPIAQADPSVGWLASFVVMSPRPAAGFPIALQQQLYGSGQSPVFTTVVSPVGSAKKVEGGYRVSGRWAWATTIQFADYISMVCRVENGEGAPLRNFLAPASSVRIMDTWNAFGMVATGTHHVVAEDVFVPDTHASTANYGDPVWYQDVRSHHSDYDLFLGPPAAALALNVTIPVLGAAQGGVELARERLLGYVRRIGGLPEREKMSAQIRLAHASSRVMAADQLMRHAIREIFTMIRDTDAESEDLFHQTRAWLAETCVLCREAMNDLTLSAGTSIFYQDSPLGRAFRDVLTGGSHIVCDYDVCMQAWGQKMLGIQPEHRKGYGEREKIRDEILATTKAHDYAVRLGQATA